MGYVWVEAIYSGEAAKVVKAHADSSVGYFILEEQRTKNGASVRAAFRIFTDTAPDPHLTQIIDSALIKKLDAKVCNRAGTHRRDLERKICEKCEAY